MSNAFATSIGAKVLSLKSACLIASLAEMIGSVALGGLVTENIITNTITPGILTSQQMMLAMLASLISVGLWLVLATWLKLPVSATHAVIGSLIGSGLTANYIAVSWSHLTSMAIAWVVSPILAGILSIAIFLILTVTILKRSDPIKSGLVAIPFIYSITLTVNISLILYQVMTKMCIKKYGFGGCIVPISISGGA